MQWDVFRDEREESDAPMLATASPDSQPVHSFPEPMPPNDKKWAMHGGAYQAGSLGVMGAGPFRQRVRADEQFKDQD